MKADIREKFFVGKPGSGKGFHSWDNLFNCPKCNSNRVWMENDNKSHTCEDSRKPVRIRCLDCDEKTKYGELHEVRSIWSRGKNEKHI